MYDSINKPVDSALSFYHTRNSDTRARRSAQVQDECVWWEKIAKKYFLQLFHLLLWLPLGW